MNKVHSHYDNLRVTRNAPVSVIKAAYRTLAAQYHPDVSQDPEAGRIMTILNAPYAVLSDPVKRRAHDEWLAQYEGAFQTAPRPIVDGDGRAAAEPPQRRAPGPVRATPGQTGPGSKLPETIYFWPLVLRLFKLVPLRIWPVVLIIGAIVWWPSIQPETETPATWNEVSEESRRKVNEALGLQPDAASPDATTASATPAPSAVPDPFDAAAEPVVASSLGGAPGGEAWPRSADYLLGYQIGATGGYSTLTIDNTNNDFDVYVKLAGAGAPPGAALRHVYIPRGASFTMEGIASDTYEVRYKNLASGSTAKTDSFALEEEHSDAGVRYSQVTFTLYTVQNGNTHMKYLPANQF